jgi:hypothetical protein
MPAHFFVYTMINRTDNSPAPTPGNPIVRSFSFELPRALRGFSTTKEVAPGAPAPGRRTLTIDQPAKHMDKPLSMNIQPEKSVKMALKIEKG